MLGSYCGYVVHILTVTILLTTAPKGANNAVHQSAISSDRSLATERARGLSSSNACRTLKCRRMRHVRVRFSADYCSPRLKQKQVQYSRAKHPAFLCDIFRFIEKYRNCHTKQNNFLQNKVSFLGAMHHFSVLFFVVFCVFLCNKKLKNVTQKRVFRTGNW